MTAAVTGAERELFDHAARPVTPADVAAFAPSDPGHPGYVATFNRILATGDLPDRPSFAVSETVGLTRWADADRESDPVRFRRFRVLTNAVALSQLRAGVEPPDDLPPNYCVVSLLNDAYRLEDRTLVRLARPVLEAFDVPQVADVWKERPFVTLGTLLADAYLGADGHHLSDLTERLVREEAACASRASADFLLGCSNFNQLHYLWVWLVDRLLPPATPTLRLVRDAIVDGGPWPAGHAR